MNMKSKTFHLIKTRTGLHPADDEAAEALKLVGFGDFVECKTKSQRSIEFHRKFMAMLRLAFHNQEAYKSFDHFRFDIMKAAGFYELTPGGNIMVYSLSFDRMDNAKFAEIYNGVHSTICEVFEIGDDDFSRELLNFM